MVFRCLGWVVAPESHVKCSECAEVTTNTLAPRSKFPPFPAFCGRWASGELPGTLLKDSQGIGGLPVLPWAVPARPRLMDRRIALLKCVPRLIFVQLSLDHLVCVTGQTATHPRGGNENLTPAVGPTVCPETSCGSCSSSRNPNVNVCV